MIPDPDCRHAAVNLHYAAMTLHEAHLYSGADPRRAGRALEDAIKEITDAVTPLGYRLEPIADTSPGMDMRGAGEREAA